jgi:peptidoglycan/xylan/chitin deacetylase (PgdA/CDA1 family)
LTGFFPTRVLPVLMYHRIGDADRDDSFLYVSETAFKTQMRWLGDNGFETLSLDRAVELWTYNRSPSRSVLITFDDAFAETLAVAARVLTEANMRATVFAPAGLLGREVELRSPGQDSHSTSRGRIASGNELKAWRDQGFDVGSHSSTHPDLTSETPARILTEAQDSRRNLEEILQTPVVDFCYPYTHHNSICRRLVERCGYRSAFAGEPPTRDLYAIPRMMIYPHDSISRFSRKASGYYYWVSAWHQRLTFGGRHAEPPTA